jgi:hypothetical protein
MAAAAAAATAVRRTESVIYRDEIVSSCETNTKAIKDLVDGYKDPMDDDYNDTDYRYFIPSIQRLWSWKGKNGRKKQNDLLNTIFRGLPIPAMILGHKRNHFGMDRYGVYDGRHRMRTLSLFIQNKIPYVIQSGDEKGTKVFYRQLSIVDQLTFDKYQIPTIIIKDPCVDVEGEVFVRTNLGKPLTSEQLCYAEIGRTSLFTRTAEKLRSNADRFLRVFGQDFSKTQKDTAMRKYIAHWSGFMLAAAKKSPGLATTAYPRLSEYSNITDEDWDGDMVNHAINCVLRLYQKVETDGCIIDPKDMPKFMKLGNINAFFLYDIITGEETPTIQKWSAIVSKVYTDPDKHAHVLHVSGAQNLTSTKISTVMGQIEAHDWSCETQHRIEDELGSDADE